MRQRLTILLGVGMMLIALFPFSAFASYESFGPQTSDDKYYYWGSATTPPYVGNGINISLDTTSTSYQSIKATITMDANLINDRDIQLFSVLMNGVNVDFFNVYYDNDLTPPRYREYYTIDIDVTDVYIGSYAYFQILGLSYDSSDQQYVVAWSPQSETVRLKPFPVTDSETHGWLQSIYYILQDLKNTLAGKLDQLRAAVEKIYTVTPETQQKFDNAMEELKQALPSEQMKDQFNQVSDMVNGSANQIANTPQETKFGQINWMGAVTTSALNFDDMEEQLGLLRKIMRISLWCEFFYFVILILRPRFTV